MKKLLFLVFSLAFLIGCQDTVKQEEKTLDENVLFGTSFMNYKELDVLKGYEKEIDTSVFMGGYEDNYRLLNLQKNGNFLLLFYKVMERDTAAAGQAISYRAIDTILVRDLDEDERLTVGYCYHEDYYEGEVIALVKENDSLYVSDIVRAWRANPESEEIEELKDHDGIKCLNEFFESENTSIPIEKIS